MTAVVSMFGMVPNLKNVPNDTTFVLPNRLMGVEVEAEQRGDSSIPSQRALSLWAVKTDGSLLNGREYVLQRPMCGNVLAAAVHELYRAGVFAAAATSSTHIHLDIRDENVTGEVLQVLFALVYMLEPVLFGVGDASRKWGGYTHSIRDLPEGIVEAIIGDDGKFNASKFKVHAINTSRYYGFNLAAISKYGSIEFRYFPTAASAEQLIGWINLVQSFAAASEGIGGLAELVTKLSTREGYLSLLDEWFAPFKRTIIELVPYKEAKATLEEVTSVAKYLPVSDLARPPSKEVILQAHPYLRKVLKKRTNTAPSLAPDLLSQRQGGQGLGARVSHLGAYPYSEQVLRAYRAAGAAEGFTDGVALCVAASAQRTTETR